MEIATLNVLLAAGFYRISTKVPIAISAPPMSVFAVTASWRKMKAIRMPRTTLNLSTGMTFEASPIWSALK